MAAQHTPAPWRAVGQFVNGPDDKTVARIDLHGDEAHPHNSHWRLPAATDQDIANARLIAAAPDLLAALQDARERMIGSSPGLKALVARTEAAIAKATGAA